MKEIKQLIITDNKNELAISIRELKNLENQVKIHNQKIKDLKDKIKASDYSQIFISTEDESLLCSIVKYDTERVVWDGDYLTKILSDEEYEIAHKITKIQNVRITLK